jgi:cytochrome bd ubiquinol oxidase subunit I
LIGAIGFDPTAWLSFLVVGIGLIIHITLVNMVLGMSVIVPITEFIGYLRKDAAMLDLAKRLFRYLILSDLIAGVFGTWVAIDLAAFFPKLLYIFSTVLFIPTLIAVIGIVMSIPAIAVYWYGWQRLSPKAHLAVGGVMAAGALLVPAGFRVLFAFVDDPAGFNITSLSGSTGLVSTNLGSLFGNPIYVTLLFHSWFGGLTMSALFAAGVYGWHFNKRTKGSSFPWRFSRSNLSRFPFWTKQIRAGSEDVPTMSSEEDEKPSSEIQREHKFLRYLLRIGLIFLTIQSAIGILYFFILEKYSPYIFASITGNTSVATYNFELLFAPFISLILIMWFSTLVLFFQTRRRLGPLWLPRVSKFVSFLLAFSTFVALPLGEASNDASRAPYMLIMGDSGIAANNFANSEIPIGWSIAYYLLALIVVVIVIFLSTVYFVYIRHNKPYPRQ